jgi:hypothetical protein
MHSIEMSVESMSIARRPKSRASRPRARTPVELRLSQCAHASAPRSLRRCGSRRA